MLLLVLLFGTVVGAGVVARQPEPAKPEEPWQIVDVGNNSRIDTSLDSGSETDVVEVLAGTDTATLEAAAQASGSVLLPLRASPGEDELLVFFGYLSTLTCGDQRVDSVELTDDVLYIDLGPTGLDPCGEAITGIDVSLLYDLDGAAVPSYVEVEGVRSPVVPA